MTVRLSTKLAKALLGDSTGATQNCLKKILEDGKLQIYSGTQPATAATAPTGTLLVEIRSAAGSSPGRYGLEFEPDARDNVLPKETTETWQGNGLAAGTAGWFRFYLAGYSPGGSNGTDTICFDGSIATSGADLNMSNTTIVADATTTIDTFTVTLPLT